MPGCSNSNDVNQGGVPTKKDTSIHSADLRRSAEFRQQEKGTARAALIDVAWSHLLHDYTRATRQTTSMSCKPAILKRTAHVEAIISIFVGGIPVESCRLQYRNMLYGNPDGLFSAE